MGEGIQPPAPVLSSGMQGWDSSFQPSTHWVGSPGNQPPILREGPESLH